MVSCPLLVELLLSVRLWKRVRLYLWSESHLRIVTIRIYLLYVGFVSNVVESTG